MFLKLITKSVLVLSLLAMQQAYAITNTKQILCPSYDTLRLSSWKIDRATPFDESYVVATSRPAFYENDYHWIIVVTVNAESREQAVKKARKAVGHISYSEDKYATDPGNGQYSCSYGPRKLGEVYAKVVNR